MTPSSAASNGKLSTTTRDSRSGTPAGPNDGAASSTAKSSGWSRLYHGETNIDFIGRWKVWFAVSGAVILLGLGALGVRGLNLGIDFKGGNVWEAPAGSASVGDVRSSMEKLGLRDVQVQVVTATSGAAGERRRVRVQAESAKGSDAAARARNDRVVTSIAQVTGSRESQVTVNEVGPSWGRQISEKARNALIVFLIAITLYITLRFEFKMAVATLAALVHDLLVVVGIYALVGLPVTPATVIAILTILGFSIYDGIVVFDRVDENTRLLSSSGRITYSEMTNLSLNQVLMRSLNTSITALLPILSVLVVGSLVLGATTLEEFGLALFIGLLSGAYSSIFIASPVLALLKEREPRYRALRKRIAERSGRVPETRLASERALTASPPPEPQDRAPVAAGARSGSTAASRPSSPPADEPRVRAGGSSAASKRPTPAARTYSANHPPRPRKKGKKR